MKSLKDQVQARKDKAEEDKKEKADKAALTPPLAAQPAPSPAPSAAASPSVSSVGRRTPRTSIAPLVVDSDDDNFADVP